MTWGLILLISVVMLLIGIMPKRPSERTWRHAPVSSVSLLLSLVVVLLLLGEV